MRAELTSDISGDMRRMDASPILTRSNASARSGMDSRPFTVTREPMPLVSRPCHLVCHKGPRGAITTVRAPVLS